MEVNMLFAKSIHMRIDSGRPTKKTHGYFLKWLEMYSDGQKLEVEVSTSPNKKTKIQKRSERIRHFQSGPILKKVFPT
jgi:hypothetical protein